MVWGIIKRNKGVFGVGLNDAGYVTQTKVNGKKVWCPLFRAWVGMLRRVHHLSHKKTHPWYIGTTMCEEWLTFSTFKAWMETQDWVGKAIDKDIIVPGNKHYSPETCCFVTQAVNNVLTNNRPKEGARTCPHGVRFMQGLNPYVATISRWGVQSYLGTYKTPEAAEAVYLKARKQYLMDVADEQVDPRIAEGFRRHAALIVLGDEG